MLQFSPPCFKCCLWTSLCFCVMSTILKVNMEEKYEEEIKLLQLDIETWEAEREECLRAVSRQHTETLRNILWVATKCPKYSRASSLSCTVHDNGSFSFMYSAVHCPFLIYLLTYCQYLRKNTKHRDNKQTHADPRWGSNPDHAGARQQCKPPPFCLPNSSTFVSLVHKIFLGILFGNN